jgi:hypothetical protein
MIFPHHVIGPAPATEKPLGHEGQPRQRVIQSARLGKEQPSGTHGTRVAQPATSPHASAAAALLRVAAVWISRSDSGVMTK